MSRREPETPDVHQDVSEKQERDETLAVKMNYTL